MGLWAMALEQMYKAGRAAFLRIKMPDYLSCRLAGEFIRQQHKAGDIAILCAR